MKATGNLLKAYLFIHFSISPFSSLLVPVRLQKPAVSGQHADTEKLPPIVRGNDSKEVEASVEAMSQDNNVASLDGISYILLLKIKKVQRGGTPARYVRADFASHQVYTDPKYEQMHTLLLQKGKTWKIHLRPSDWISECAWSIPAPPKPGELFMPGIPIMLPVGGAKRYPDINTLPCYAFELKDIEGVVLPSK
jgi:hypothetical protein